MAVSTLWIHFNTLDQDPYFTFSERIRCGNCSFPWPCLLPEPCWFLTISPIAMFLFPILAPRVNASRISICSALLIVRVCVRSSSR